ncbi:MAG TPA: hypothetical protein VJ983_00370 [candidate division Zixibacteria bacterium]|nr:hypothetical protein [candidate division Zixibacteria bacterium]
MKKLAIFAAVAVLLGFCRTAWADDAESQTLTLANKHQFGLRLGTWINNGETPPKLVTATDGSTLKTSVNDASFYLEGYFAYHLIPQTFLQISFGMVNRGSVTYYDGVQGTTDVGNLMVYPILLQAKLYPLASLPSRLQPYVGVGGGVYYGKRSIQFTNNLFYAYYPEYSLNHDSQTDFNYTISGGVDWLLSNTIAMDLNAKYMPVNFSNPLVTIKDYKALTIAVGIKYLYTPKKKSEDHGGTRR